MTARHFHATRARFQVLREHVKVTAAQVQLSSIGD
jgi:hypothetical protein